MDKPVDVATACNAKGAGRMDFESETFATTIRGYSDYGDGLPCIRANGGDCAGGSEVLVSHVTHSLRADGFDAREDGTGRGTPLVPRARHEQCDSERCSAQGVGQKTYTVRRLLPAECCKLQGFSPHYFDGILHRGKPLADGNKYKMLGNSFAVPVVRWIGERIIAAAHADTPDDHTDERHANVQQRGHNP